jgi:hypothetical protein
LEEIQAKDNMWNSVAEAQIKDEIHELLEQEELKWKQRAKEDWLRYGDRNTKYFHACANQRKRVNQIDQIRNVAGV